MVYSIFEFNFHKSHNTSWIFVAITVNEIWKSKQVWDLGGFILGFWDVILWLVSWSYLEDKGSRFPWNIDTSQCLWCYIPTDSKVWGMSWVVERPSITQQYPLLQIYTAVCVENAFISMNFSVLKCRGWINTATIIHLPIFWWVTVWLHV